MLRLLGLALVGYTAYRIAQENQMFEGSSLRGYRADSREDELDKALEDTFPASDPPAAVSPTVAGAQPSGTDEELKRQGRIH